MLKGTLDDFTLPDVFRLMSFAKKTGCVDVVRSAGAGLVRVFPGKDACTPGDREHQQYLVAEVQVFLKEPLFPLFAPPIAPQISPPLKRQPLL